jgi:hypothetical protein
MVLTAYLVLTPERPGLVVSVAAQLVPHDLAPATWASGRRALAVRQRVARQANAFASIASRPAIVTTRSPLCNRGGTSEREPWFSEIRKLIISCSRAGQRRAFDSDLRKVICPTGTWSHATKGSDADTRSHHGTIASGGDHRFLYVQNDASNSSPLERPMIHQRSHIEEQAADALRRARKLPVGPTRNDLRQLAMGLLWLHRNGMDALVENRIASLRSVDHITRSGPPLKRLRH